MPTRYPASTILITVPPHVSSISSGCAAMARMSRSMVKRWLSSGRPRALESPQERPLVQAILESLPSANKDDGNLFLELRISLRVFEDVHLAPLKAMDLLQIAEPGFHFVAQAAARLGIDHHFESSHCDIVRQGQGVVLD